MALEQYIVIVIPKTIAWPLRPDARQRLRMLLTTTAPIVYTDSGVRAFHLGDAADFESLLGQQAECIQLGTDPISIDVLQVCTGAASIWRCVASGAFQLRHRVSDQKLTIAFVNDAVAVSADGHRWTREHLLVATGRDIDMGSLGAADFVWIEIDLRLLAESNFEAVLNVSRKTNMVLSTERAPMAELRSYVNDVLDKCKRDGTIVKSAGIWTRIESELLRRIGAVLRSSSAGAYAERERKAFSLVQRVESFMWENVEEPLTLKRICANTDCRMRTLIYCFKECFGIGPITYLKTLRLNAVHRRLKKARGAVRIFDVATDYGFWHMGHFSTDYKRMFGVTPTETVWWARSREHSSSEPCPVPVDPRAVPMRDRPHLTASFLK